MGILNRLGLKKEQKPILKEIAVGKSKLESFTYIQNYNPDELVTRRGLEIYDKMMMDAQVKACISAKINARLASEWEIFSASQNAKDIEVKEFVEDQINNMAGTFDDDLYDIMEALIKGYSITEINYQVIKEGRWKGKIGLLSLKSKDPKNFNFDLDDYLNIKRLINIIDGQETYLDPRKFIIFVYNKKHERPWGQSDLRAAYRDWLTKDICYKERNISAQRLAQPVVLGMYGESVSSSEQDTLFNKLKNIQFETTMILPKDIEVVIKEARESGSEEFQRIIDNCNLEITKAILGATLIIEESKRYGSYAAAKVQYEMLMFYLLRLGIQMESVINDQLITRLVDYNYNVQNYPVWKWKEYRTVDINKISDMILSLIDKGIVSKNEPWIRDKLNLPKVEKENNLLQDIQYQINSYVYKNPQIDLNQIPINVGRIKNYLSSKIGQDMAYQIAGFIKNDIKEKLLSMKEYNEDEINSHLMRYNYLLG